MSDHRKLWKVTFWNSNQIPGHDKGHDWYVIAVHCLQAISIAHQHCERDNGMMKVSGAQAILLDDRILEASFTALHDEPTCESVDTVSGKRCVMAVEHRGLHFNAAGSGWLGDKTALEEI